MPCHPAQPFAYEIVNAATHPKSEHPMISLAAMILIPLALVVLFTGQEV